MNPYHFLLVVLSLGCGSLPATGEIDLLRAAAATIGLVLGWGLLCLVAARQIAAVARAGDLDPIAAAECFERQLGGFRWIGLGVVTLGLAGFGLAPAATVTPPFADWMLLQSVLLLGPGLLLSGLLAAAEHSFATRMTNAEIQYGFLADLRRSGSFVIAQFRSGLGWLVVPVLVLMAAGDGLRHLPIDPDTIQYFVPVLAVLFIVFGLPLVIRMVFKTSPIADQQRSLIENWLTAAGLPAMAVRRWNTGGTTFNAMVAGFMRPMRSLMISDRILDELPTDQIATIVLHEAGHIRRRHMPIRMLAVTPAWAIGHAASLITGGLWWSSLAGLLSGLAATMLVLRIVSHQTELDADRWARDAAVRLGILPDEDAAAAAMSAALRRVTFDSPRSRRRSWLHPSVDDRILNLNAGAAANAAAAEHVATA